MSSSSASVRTGPMGPSVILFSARKASLGGGTALLHQSFKDLITASSSPGEAEVRVMDLVQPVTSEER
eukprot:7939175-Pyramimonas_sp.AAC.1